MGLVSNAGDDRNVQTLVDREGLRPFFEFTITSAACGWRKPDARIFQLALDHFGVRPAEAVMIGDTLEADILGANRLGIYSIWITRRAILPPDGELAIQPQAVISSLTNLLPLLADSG
jgi:FMN phosphatase YigB (HAD superfamily)